MWCRQSPQHSGFKEWRKWQQALSYKQVTRVLRGRCCGCSQAKCLSTGKKRWHGGICKTNLWSISLAEPSLHQIVMNGKGRRGWREGVPLLRHQEIAKVMKRRLNGRGKERRKGRYGNTRILWWRLELGSLKGQESDSHDPLALCTTRVRERARWRPIVHQHSQPGKSTQQS